MFEASIPDRSKVDIRNGVHQSDDEYKIALFNQAEATDKNRHCTHYTSLGELPSAGGYLRGGKMLKGFSRRECAGDNGAANEVWIDFADPVWTNVSLSADAARHIQRVEVEQDSDSSLVWPNRGHERNLYRRAF